MAAPRRRASQRPPGSTRGAAKSSPRCTLLDASCTSPPHSRRWRRSTSGPPISRALEHVGFVGDGAVRYRAEIGQRLGDRAVIASDAPPLAAAIAEIAAADPSRAVRPHALVPLYVRRPDAELARDRAARS